MNAKSRNSYHSCFIDGVLRPQWKEYASLLNLTLEIAAAGRVCFIKSLHAVSSWSFLPNGFYFVAVCFCFMRNSGSSNLLSKILSHL